MFSNLTVVRLKAAENALRDGRLDEAFRLATAPDLRDHRRALKVLTKAAGKLVQRAKSHYDAGLYNEALADLNRAATANIDLPEINRLRDEIREAARQSRYREQQQQRRVGAARQRIEAGSLVGGQQLLDQADTRDPQAQQLRQIAEANAAQARSEIGEAEKLLKQDRIAEAVERLRRARSLNAHDPQTSELEGKIVKHLHDAAHGAVKEGRTDRAQAQLDLIRRLGRNDPRRHELERNLELIGRVARTAAAAQYDEALRVLRQLRHLLPDVRWIKEAEEQVSKLRDTSLALLSGPLGIAGDSEKGSGVAGRPVPVRAAAGRTADQPTVRIASHAPSQTSLRGGAMPGSEESGLPARLLMLIDGVGSYLVLTQPRVSLGRLTAGPGSSDSVADIALLADISRHHADIARIDDDYFIFPHRDVFIDGEPTSHRLLFDKNRITLGKLARITYRLPNPRSSTAVLTLSDSVRMSHGVRDILLFSQLAVLGPGRHCHVRLPRVKDNLILYAQKGKLFMRPQPKRPEERFDPHEKQEIRLGQPFTMLDIGFCFEPWPDESGTSGAKT
jgi:tetratricopeptide (TPR) repeat protein